MRELSALFPDGIPTDAEIRAEARKTNARQRAMLDGMRAWAIYFGRLEGTQNDACQTGHEALAAYLAAGGKLDEETR